MTQQPTPIRIFMAYSRKDNEYLKGIQTALNPLTRSGSIKLWHDGAIIPGEKWDDAIKKNLHEANIVLLLLSNDSLASDYFYDEEVTNALKRHHKGECTVVPIIVRDCLWEETPLSDLQALPKDGKPIADWTSPDAAYKSIALGISKLVTNLQNSPPPPVPTPTDTPNNTPTSNPTPLTVFLETCHQADEFYEQDAWKDARRLYTEALKLHQNGFKPTTETLKQKIDDCAEEIDAANHLQRAQKYESQQKYPEAIAQLQAAIKLKPELQNEHSSKLQELAEKEAAVEEQAEKEAAAKRQAEKERQAREQANKVAAAKRQAEKERQERNPTIKMISIPGKNFQLSETPITIEQYLAFCKATNSHYPEWLEKGSQYNIHTGSDDHYKKVGMSESNSNYPITGVSALDADAFCKWMGGRLPTEQEWEYAAKGGQNYEYAGSNNIDDVAWYDGNSGGKCHPVKQKQANGYGLYDMSGNVWEWTSSTEGSNRVLRGGSWLSNPQCCRVAYRINYTPANRDGIIGFRLAVR